VCTRMGPVRRCRDMPPELVYEVGVDILMHVAVSLAKGGSWHRALVAMRLWAERSADGVFQGHFASLPGHSTAQVLIGDEHDGAVRAISWRW